MYSCKIECGTPRSTHLYLLALPRAGVEIINNNTIRSTSQNDVEKKTNSFFFHVQTGTKFITARCTGTARKTIQYIPMFKCNELGSNLLLQTFQQYHKRLTITSTTCGNVVCTYT